MRSVRSMTEADVLRQQYQSALRALVKSPGWKSFVGQMRKKQHELYENAIESDNPEQTAKALGGHYAIQWMLEWPDREFKEATTEEERATEGELPDSHEGD